MICKRSGCDRPVPFERHEAGSPYCSPRCRNIAARSRSPSHRRHPFAKFIQAVEKHWAVGEDRESQERARKMVANGAAAYENARGIIRDVGVPRSEQHAGVLFVARRPR